MSYAVKYVFLATFIKGIVPLASFDVWGTLLDVNAFYSSAAKALEEITGIPYPRAEELLQKAYREVKAARRQKLIDEQDIVGSSIKIAIERVRLPFTVYDLNWAFAHAANTINPSLLLLSGTVDTLQILAENGFNLAVTSNVVFWPGYLTRIIIDRVGLSKFFRIQVFADEARSLKPDPKIFVEILRATNASPEETVHIGDSPQEDLAGALASDIAGILVDKVVSRNYIDKNLRIAIVKSITEVPDVIPKVIAL